MTLVLKKGARVELARCHLTLHKYTLKDRRVFETRESKLPLCAKLLSGEKKNIYIYFVRMKFS